MTNAAYLFKYRYASKLVKGKLIGRWRLSHVVKNRPQIFHAFDDATGMGGTLFTVNSHLNEVTGRPRMTRSTFLGRMIVFNNILAPTNIRHNQKRALNVIGRAVFVDSEEESGSEEESDSDEEDEDHGGWSLGGGDGTIGRGGS